MKDQKIEAVILSKEEAFWTQKKEVSERMVKAMEQDLEDIPHLIRFHQAVIDMCKQKIKKSK